MEKITETLFWEEKETTSGILKLPLHRFHDCEWRSMASGLTRLEMP